MLEQYSRIEIGSDCLEPGLKRERVLLKARFLEGLPAPTEEDLLQEAQDRADKD